MIVQTKQFFHSSLTSLLAGERAPVSALRSVLLSSVLWMRMMVVTVEEEVNLCQWFLWLQADMSPMFDDVRNRQYIFHKDHLNSSS